MLKDKIIKKAKELGLLIGFANYQEYKELNTSRFKSDKLDFAKSIISFAYPISKNDKYNVASFALETDYHKVLKEKLRIIKNLILDEVNAKIEYYVDDGPMDDKLCAYLAGIGHYGKNSLIITKEYGSYVMLGEIVTDLVFEYDLKSTINCGSCNLCVTKCPNNAMDDIYKKCLTGYLQRKDIDIYEYNNISTIYGCDICKSICPKNIRVYEKNEYIYDNINIRDILKSSKKEFKEKYKDTAFFWLGHNLMKRNAIIYAKNNDIDISEELKYVNSKEDYMLKAIDYYNKVR